MACHHGGVMRTLPPSTPSTKSTDGKSVATATPTAPSKKRKKSYKTQTKTLKSPYSQLRLSFNAPISIPRISPKDKRANRQCKFMGSCESNLLLSSQHWGMFKVAYLLSGLKKKKRGKLSSFSICPLLRSVSSVTVVLSCALRSGRGEIPDLLL